MTNTFTIEAPTESGTFVIFATSSRTKAVVIFPSQEKAEAFVRGYHAPELRVLQLTPEMIHAWMANVCSHGVTHAIVDPPVNGALKHAAYANLEAVLDAALGNEGVRQQTA